MRPRNWMAPFLLFCALSLMGCEKSREQVKLVQVKPDIPMNLYYCPEEPTKPIVATQRTVALIILDFQEALATCQENLRAIREIVERK